MVPKKAKDLSEKGFKISPVITQALLNLYLFMDQFLTSYHSSANLRGELAAVGDDDDDGGLEVEGVAALPVHVDPRLHPVDVEGVEDLLEGGPEGGHAGGVQVLELVHEGHEVLLPARLDVPRELLEGQQHVPVAPDQTVNCQI